jgi:hypothetical protein
MAAGVAMAAMPAVAAATAAAAAAEMEEDHNYNHHHLVLPAWFMDQAVVTITTILPETTTRLMLKDCC